MDLLNSYVRVAKRKVAGEEDAPKGNKQRDIKLPPRALAAVEGQRAFTQLLDGKVFHHPELHAEYHDTRPLSEVYWETTLKRLGLRRRTLYATRHTCATLALMAGVHPHKIARQLGNSPRMIFETYGKWLEEDYDEQTARPQI